MEPALPVSFGPFLSAAMDRVETKSASGFQIIAAKSMITNVVTRRKR